MTQLVVKITGFDKNGKISGTVKEGSSAVDHYEVKVNSGSWINVGTSTSYTVTLSHVNKSLFSASNPATENNVTSGMTRTAVAIKAIAREGSGYTDSDSKASSYVANTIEQQAIASSGDHLINNYGSRYYFPGTLF